MKTAQGFSLHIEYPYFTWSAAQIPAIFLYYNNQDLFYDGVRFHRPLDSEQIFLTSLEVPGRYELFTCTCGNFGCGGANADIAHTETAWIIEGLEVIHNEDEVAWCNYRESWPRMIALIDELLAAYRYYGIPYQERRYQDLVSRLKTKHHPDDNRNSLPNPSLH